MMHANITSVSTSTGPVQKQRISVSIFHSPHEWSASSAQNPTNEVCFSFFSSDNKKRR